MRSHWHWPAQNRHSEGACRPLAARGAGLGLSGSRGRRPVTEPPMLALLLHARILPAQMGRLSPCCQDGSHPHSGTHLDQGARACSRDCHRGQLPPLPAPPPSPSPSACQHAPGNLLSFPCQLARFRCNVPALAASSTCCISHPLGHILLHNAAQPAAQPLLL